MIGLGLGLLAVVIGIWLGLRAQEQRQIREVAAIEAREVARVLVREMEDRAQTMAWFARRWERQGGMSREAWEVEAETFHQNRRGYRTIAFADPSGRVPWSLPREANEELTLEGMLAEPPVRAAVQRARQTRRTVSATVDPVEGEGGSLILAPAFVGDRYDGVIVGFVRTDELAGRALDLLNGRGFEGAVYLGDRLIAGRGDPASRQIARFGGTAAEELPGMIWRVEAWPRRDWLGRTKSLVPTWVLAFGIAIAVTLPLVVHLGRIARAERDQLVEVSKALEDENDKRRGAEERLRELNEALETKVADRTRELEASRAEALRFVEQLQGLTGELRSANAALEQRERTFRELFESSPDALLLADAEGRLSLVNGSAEKIFGYGRGEMLGQPVEMLLPERLRARHVEMREGYVRQAEIRPMSARPDLVARAKDGREIPVEIALGPIHTETGPCVLATVRDVTIRREAERLVRRLNEELEERVRMRTAELEVVNRELESFSYSVSHDLRAPLRHMSGFLGLLERQIGEKLDDQGRHYLNVVDEAAANMGTLIDELLAFSRAGRVALNLQALNLRQVAEEVCREFREGADGRQIEWTIGELPQVRGDRAMLRLVLQNLIDNAVKFTRPRATARIEIGCCSGNGREATVFVRDNGVGFEMNQAEKLFEVFKRLHASEEFEGTGVGLANVRRIVERHGGRVWAQSQVGGGATFYFTLPRAGAPNAEEARA